MQLKIESFKVHVCVRERGTVSESPDSLGHALETGVLPQKPEHNNIHTLHKLLTPNPQNGRNISIQSDCQNSFEFGQSHEAKELVFCSKTLSQLKEQ